MKQSRKTIMASQKNILAIGGHFVNTNIKVEATKVTASDKILLAGTVVDKLGNEVNAITGNEADAFGVVYNDVDFTDSTGTEVVSVLVHGFVKESEMPVAPTQAIKDKLNQILFL